MLKFDVPVIHVKKKNHPNFTDGTLRFYEKMDNFKSVPMMNL